MELLLLTHRLFNRKGGGNKTMTPKKERPFRGEVPNGQGAKNSNSAIQLYPTPKASCGQGLGCNIHHDEVEL